MRTFDCFPFFNELDLLEVRLEELWNTVDFFVIAEATFTHQGHPKPLHLKNNLGRFEKYKSKIRHIVVEDMPNHSNSWINENFQRRALERGLWDLKYDDVIIVSDADELPRAATIDFIKNDNSCKGIDRFHLYCPLHNFRFNFLMTHPNGMHPNIVVTKGKVFTDPHSERTFAFPWIQKPSYIKTIQHGGWHFSYLGDTEVAKAKIRSFAHVETQNTPNLMDTLNVDELVKNKLFLAGEEGEHRHEYTILDDYYPAYIRNNSDRFSKYIVPEGNVSVYSIYPKT